MPSDLAVPRLPAVPCPSNAPLLARATISSFIPSHTKFYSFFASHAACALQLPARAASLDPLLRRYRINRSPFAQAKRKDVFERKIHRNVIEIRGEKARAADAWEWWLRRNAPPGVVIEVERWSAESFGFGSRMREFEKRWRGDNEALLREAKEKGETVRTIDGYLAKPKDPASVVMNKVEEILGKWKQADQAAKKKRSKK